MNQGDRYRRRNRFDRRREGRLRHWIPVALFAALLALLLWFPFRCKKLYIQRGMMTRDEQNG